MKPGLIISKLDAAKRQLETVIRIYFSNGDPVSIHTLTAAAYNILKDINKKRGGTPLLLKEQFIGFVKPEYHKLIKEKLNEAENFFKHADHDHDATLKFNPEQSEFLIYEACTTYSILTGEVPPLLKVYKVWYISHHADLYEFTEDVKKEIMKCIPTVLSMSREEYYNTILPVALSFRI
jgi:hypothetical protein